MILFRHKIIKHFLMYGIIIAFLGGMLFLVGGRTGRWGRSEPTALKINGDKVSFRQFEKIFRQMLEKQRGRNVESEQIRQQTIDEITKQYLLLQQINRMDINISDKEVIQEIQKNEQEIQWYNMFRERGLANAYIKEKKANIGLQRLKDILYDLALVTDNEVKQEYNKKNEKVKIKYIQFPNHEFRSDIKIDEQEAQNYFQENKEKYEVNDQADIKFVKIDPKQMVNDEDIEKYYNENKDEFKESEKVKARHILLKVDADASDEDKAKVKEQAEKVLEEAKKPGADFAKLAEKYSEDKGSAKKGGDLGFFERGRMVKPFEEAAFSLKPGEISDLVETTYGYHIIKVEDKKPVSISPFEKVKTQIKQKIVEQITAEDAKQIADELLYDVRVDGFEEAVKQKRYLDLFTDDKREKYKNLDLEAKTTGFFEKDASSIPNIGSSWTYKSLVEKVFDMRKNAVDNIEVRNYQGNIDSYFVIELIDKKLRHIPEFSEAKDDVENDIKDEKAKSAAFEAAKQLMNKYEDGDTLETLVKKYESPEDEKEKQVKETKPFAISSSGYIPNLGRAREVMLAAFNLELNEIAGPFKGNNGAFIIQLVEREKAELEKGEEFVNTRKNLLQEREYQVFQKWYNGVKSQARIVDNTIRRQRS